MINPAPITALVYTDSEKADRTLRTIAGELMDRGWALAGLVQHNDFRENRSRCNMVLEELASGERIGIADDRGKLARGCALDVDRLLHAMQMVERSLAARPDLVVLNKYGKTESEGAGFRPLIAAVVEAGLPLLIGVPWRNIDNWRIFAGDIAGEHKLEDLPSGGRTLCDVLGLGYRMPASGRAGLQA